MANLVIMESPSKSNTVKSYLGSNYKVIELLKKLQPEDLLKFGLIPEFIGRVPVYAVLDPLEESTLKNILTQPKNALLKQYQCLLGMDGVELKFDPEAVDLIAAEAIKRKTGARALRSIVEEIMMDIMFALPAQEDVKEFVVTADMVQKKNEGVAELIQLPTKKEEDKDASEPQLKPAEEIA